LFFWKAALTLLGDGDAVPSLQSSVDVRPMRCSDIVAMRRLGRASGKHASAMRKGQAIQGLVKSKHLLKPLPDRVTSLIPTELVGVDEASGRN
jgi:hypothetical protein